MRSADCANPSTRRRERLAWAAAFICLWLGPATGLARAIHLAGAGHDHHANACPVCQQMASTSKYVLDSPTQVMASADSVWITGCIHRARHPGTFVPRRVLPRAPPKDSTHWMCRFQPTDV